MSDAPERHWTPPEHRPESKLVGHSLTSRALYQVARGALLALLRGYNSLSVDGREHVPAEGAFVMAPTHRSNLDTPIASVATRRRMRFMGKHTLWENRFTAWLLSSLGGFPVVRGTADMEAVRRALDVLVEGEPLVLFPEGERKSGPVVQPLFDGAAWTAAKAGVPIVPMGIGGSEAAMRKGSKAIHRAKIHVVIGEPIPPPPMQGRRVDRAAMAETTHRLHAELQRLFDLAGQRAGRDH